MKRCVDKARRANHTRRVFIELLPTRFTCLCPGRRLRRHVFLEAPKTSFKGLKNARKLLCSLPATVLGAHLRACSSYLMTRKPGGHCEEIPLIGSKTGC